MATPELDAQRYVGVGMTIIRIIHWDYDKQIALAQFKTRGNVIPVKWVPMDMLKLKILMGFSNERR